MTNQSRVVFAAIVENIITLCIFAVIVILAPGLWKWAGIACLLNLNSIKLTKVNNDH